MTVVGAHRRNIDELREAKRRWEEKRDNLPSMEEIYKTREEMAQLKQELEEKTEQFQRAIAERANVYKPSAVAEEANQYEELLPEHGRKTVYSRTIGEWKKRYNESPDDDLCNVEEQVIPAIERQRAKYQEAFRRAQEALAEFEGEGSTPDDTNEEEYNEYDENQEEN